MAYKMSSFVHGRRQEPRVPDDDKKSTVAVLGSED